MSTTLVAGLFGLVGTLIGGVLTIWTARVTADRSQQRAREEQQRQEYRSAVIEFATALGAYRQAELDRWYARHGGWRDEVSASTDVYRARTSAWDAFHQLDLSTNNRDLVNEAQRTFDWANSIRFTESEKEMVHRADQVTRELTQLIAIARTGKLADPSATMPPPTDRQS